MPLANTVSATAFAVEVLPKVQAHQRQQDEHEHEVVQVEGDVAESSPDVCSDPRGEVAGIKHASPFGHHFALEISPRTKKSANVATSVPLEHVKPYPASPRWRNKEERDARLVRPKTEEITMGAEDKIKNAAEDLKGKGKEAVGKATNDSKLEADGKADQAKAGVKKVGEDIKDAVK